MQTKSGIGTKHCLTEAFLGWKCFGKYKKYRDFYTFSGEYVWDFIRKSVKGGRVSDLIRYFDTNQCEEILNTYKKHLDRYDIKISTIVDEFLKFINI